MKSLSHVQLFVTPWTVAYQVPPSMEFPRQEYWRGLPFPSLGDLPNPGLLHCRQTLYRLSHQGSPKIIFHLTLILKPETIKRILYDFINAECPEKAKQTSASLRLEVSVASDCKKA